MQPRPRDPVSHGAVESALDTVDKQPSAVLASNQTQPGKRSVETPYCTSFCFSMADCLEESCCRGTEQRFVNHQVARIWPQFYQRQIERLREHPYTSSTLGPFELRLKSAGEVPAPVVKRIGKLMCRMFFKCNLFIDSDSQTLRNIDIKPQPYIGAPMRFECDIYETSDTEMDFFVTPRGSTNDFETGGVVEIDVHEVQIKARVVVTVYSKSRKVEYYFVDKPEVHLKWDLDNEVLPASVVKNFATDAKLCDVLECVDKEHPACVYLDRGAVKPPQEVDQNMINHNVAVLWPKFYQRSIEHLKMHPYRSPKLLPFELWLKRAGYIEAPALNNVTITPREGVDLSWECDFNLNLDEGSKSDFEWILVPRKGRRTSVMDSIKHIFASGTVFDVHSLEVRARVAVKVWFKKHRVEYYFVKKPHIHVTWDVSSTLTPESMLKNMATDDKLEIAMEHIDEEHPKVVTWTIDER